MFRPISIIYFNDFIYEINNRSRVLEHENYKRLGFFDKIRIDRLNKMIKSIIREVEDSSNWEYYHNTFIYKSNYKYDSTREDITFTINSITRDNNGYKPSNNSELELDFYNKYTSLLARLSYLQDKRDYIYGETNIIEFDTIRKLNENKDNFPFINDYSLNQAKSFIDDYGFDGIKNLIILLKDSESLSIDDLYERVKNLYLGKNYTLDLLSWLGTYNKTGRILLDNYYDEINPNITWEVPDIEEMKTKLLFRI